MRAIPREARAVCLVDPADEAAFRSAVAGAAKRLREAYERALELDPEVSRRMLARAVSFVPALGELPVTREWYGFRPFRREGPFVGRQASGVYAITGHEGAGVGLGPLHAQQLAAQLT